MKRDELKSIIPDITDDQVNQLMAIHGADIERHKQQLATLTAELEEAKGKYPETADRLAGLDAEYKAKAEAAEQAAAEKLDGMQREFEFQSAAMMAMSEIKFTSKSAKKTFMRELRERNFKRVKLSTWMNFLPKPGRQTPPPLARVDTLS